MTSIKPTIFLLHGAWHTPHHYETLTSILIERGYPFSAVSLPTSGGSTETLDDDVAVARAELQRLVDAGKDIVVLMHSYGGMVGTEAVKGFSKGDHEGSGGVTRLIYLCAYALAEGGSIANSLPGPLPTWIDSVTEHQWRLNDPHHTCYNGASKEVAEQMAAGLKYQTKASFESELTYAGWKHIDSAYIVCELDNSIPAAAQEAMAMQEGRWISIERLPASHSPWILMPEETADVIEKGIGKSL